MSLVPTLGQIMTILRFASFFPLEYLVGISEHLRDILSFFKLMELKKAQILQLLFRTQICVNWSLSFTFKSELHRRDSPLWQKAAD